MLICSSLLQTRTLEDERNYFKSTCEHMSRQLGQLELRCRQLFEENQVLKQSRWGSVHSEGPTAAEVSQQVSRPPCSQQQKSGNVF